MKQLLLLLSLAFLFQSCESSKDIRGRHDSVNLLETLPHREMTERPRAITKKFQNYYLQTMVHNESPEQLYYAFLKKIKTLEYVIVREARLGPKGSQSIRLAREFPYFNQGATLYENKLEFARLNPAGDGSFEVRLNDLDGHRVVSRGWGVKHPVYKNVLLIYPAKSKEELKVSWKIFKTAYYNARNQ